VDYMSHLAIAELLGSRPDTVKISIKRLDKHGVISLTSLTERYFKADGKADNRQVYYVNQRDSYVVVAQLSPEFTAQVVDRWMELEKRKQPAIPQSYSEALMLAGQLAADNERIQIACDEAVRTKALVAEGREGTMFSKLGVITKENSKLKEAVGNATNYKAARAIPWVKDVFKIKKPGTWTVVGQQLAKLSHAMHLTPKKIENSDWDNVNTYHVDAISAFYRKLMNDSTYCEKYRRDI
jgi:phage regulator Rha-like protein